MEQAASEVIGIEIAGLVREMLERNELSLY